MWAQIGKNGLDVTMDGFSWDVMASEMAISMWSFDPGFSQPPSAASTINSSLSCLEA